MLVDSLKHPSRFNAATIAISNMYPREGRNSLIFQNCSEAFVGTHGKRSAKTFVPDPIYFSTSAPRFRIGLFSRKL